MREMSIYLSGAAFLVSFLGVVSGAFEDGWYSRRTWQVVVSPILLVGIVALTSLSCWYMWNAYTAPKGIWWVGLAIGLTMFCLLFWEMAVEFFEISFASFTTLFLVAIALTIMPFLKLVDDNPYRVQSGQVTAQDFTPEHSMISCVNNVCTTSIVADDWALKLRNCKDFSVCRSGWIHFSENVFKQYPVGSKYPRE